MITSIINSIISIVQLLILIECILSWVARDSQNEVVRAIKILVKPILEPFRKLQYKYLRDLPVDLSPVAAYFALGVLRRLVYFIL